MNTTRMETIDGAVNFLSLIYFINTNSNKICQVIEESVLLWQFTGSG